MLNSVTGNTPVAEPGIRSPRPWMPKRVVFTPDALQETFGQQIYERVRSAGLPVEELKSNRLTGLRGATAQETYRIAKNTLAVVNAPPSAAKLRPIPPSADYQFHLAEGCPAHCQYCYLAGSLQGPPVIKVFANLPAILENTLRYEQAGKITTFEASCYTDPLGIEHLTGSLAECIRHFGRREGAHLRWVTKFSRIDSLRNILHNGRTRCRFSLNAELIARRMEGGTASVAARLAAMRQLAQPRLAGGEGYPVGVVLAPIMPIADWPEHYTALLDQIAGALDFAPDLTFELISHRFTPNSKEILLDWYPNTSLDMDEEGRARKLNKFGGVKYVYQPDDMKMLRRFFEREIAQRFPQAKILYWT